jgi:hypothetical protein
MGIYAEMKAANWSSASWANPVRSTARRFAKPRTERMAISAMSQALANKKRSYDPLHPQLLPYYYFLAELHRQEGSSPASIPLYREGVSICEKNYGPESACAAELMGSLALRSPTTAISRKQRRRFTAR